MRPSKNKKNSEPLEDGIMILLSSAPFWKSDTKKSTAVQTPLSKWWIDVQKYKEEEKYEQLLFLKVGRLRGDFGHHGWIRICHHVNFPRRQQTNVLILVRNPFSRKRRGTKPNSKSDPSAKRTCKIPSQRDGHKFQTKQTKAVRLTSAIVDFFEFHRKNVRHACGKILRNRQGRART